MNIYCLLFIVYYLFCFVNKYITAHFWLFFMGFQTLPEVQFLSFAGTLLVGLSNIRIFFRVGGGLFVVFSVLFSPYYTVNIQNIPWKPHHIFAVKISNLAWIYSVLYSLVPVYRETQFHETISRPDICPILYNVLWPHNRSMNWPFILTCSRVGKLINL